MPADCLAQIVAWTFVAPRQISNREVHGQLQTLNLTIVPYYVIIKSGLTILSWYKNAYCITGPFWGESTGQRCGLVMQSFYTIFVVSLKKLVNKQLLKYEMPYHPCNIIVMSVAQHQSHHISHSKAMTWTEQKPDLHFTKTSCASCGDCWECPECYENVYIVHVRIRHSCIKWWLIPSAVINMTKV